MTDQFPTVRAYPLPEAQLRAPVPTRQTEESAKPSAADMDALCEALEPLISEAIARKARQRRYAP